MTTLNENTVEQAALSWLRELGWEVAHGPDIAPETPNAERENYGQVVLERRLRDAIVELNPGLPPGALGDALRRLTRPEGSTLEARNRSFHRMLVDGVNVEHRTRDGSIRGAQVRILDFDNPANNNFLAVNQFTVTENRNTRRPDIVLFVNGLPLGTIELKNPADEDATIWTAWQQLQTYASELPRLFSMNEALMVSDGLQARIGALNAGREWFKPWRTIAGETLADPHMTELQVMLEGVCDPARFLAMIRDFIVFDDDGSGNLVKKMAGYHQFHAVRVALDETLRAAEMQRRVPGVAEVGWRYEAGMKAGGAPGDRRIGVVWHTQGSGKSLTMAFYAGAIIREPAMENPTIVVLTDRNDLDDQLFGTFSRCQDLLRQPPVQAESRADLRNRLSVEAGGVVFTTIQKFFPEERGDCCGGWSRRISAVLDRSAPRWRRLLVHLLRPPFIVLRPEHRNIDEEWRDRRFCLSSQISVRRAEPQFKDGSVYRQNRPAVQTLGMRGAVCVGGSCVAITSSRCRQVTDSPAGITLKGSRDD